MVTQISLVIHDQNQPDLRFKVLPSLNYKKPDSDHKQLRSCNHNFSLVFIGLFTFSHGGNQNQQVGGCTFDVKVPPSQMKVVVWWQANEY